MTKTLYIIGSGGIGGHLVSNLDLYGLENHAIYFIDDDINKLNTILFGINVIGNLDYLMSISENVDVIIAIASSKLRKVIANRLKQKKNFHFPTIIARNAWVSKGVIIGDGCIIYPNCSINFGVILENFVIINMNCAIGHNTIIKSFSTLSPSVSTGGFTKILECAEIGIGSSTIQNITIGENSIVGAGSVIIRIVKENTQIFGVPAQGVNRNINSIPISTILE